MVVKSICQSVRNEVGWDNEAGRMAGWQTEKEGETREGKEGFQTIS